MKLSSVFVGPYEKLSVCMKIMSFSSSGPRTHCRTHCLGVSSAFCAVSFHCCLFWHLWIGGWCLCHCWSWLSSSLYLFSSISLHALDLFLWSSTICLMCQSNMGLLLLFSLCHNISDILKVLWFLIYSPLLPLDF